MPEAAIAVSLYEGTASKVFDAEVTNALGSPLKDVEVIFALGGEGSLAADAPVSSVASRTDGLGRATISFNRLAGEEGHLGAHLSARCPMEVGQIRLRLVGLRPKPSS